MKYAKQNCNHHSRIKMKSCIQALEPSIISIVNLISPSEEVSLSTLWNVHESLHLILLLCIGAAGLSCRLVFLYTRSCKRILTELLTAIRGRAKVALYLFVWSRELKSHGPIIQCSVGTWGSYCRARPFFDLFISCSDKLYEIGVEMNVESYREILSELIVFFEFTFSRIISNKIQ